MTKVFGMHSDDEIVVGWKGNLDEPQFDFCMELDKGKEGMGLTALAQKHDREIGVKD